MSAPPGPISDQSTVTPGALPVTMSGINLNGVPQSGASGGTEKKVPPKLQKQKSFTVTTVYTPPSNPSKAMQKLRAKTRAAKAFKNTLSVSKKFADKRVHLRLERWSQTLIELDFKNMMIGYHTVKARLCVERAFVFLGVY